MEHNKKTTKTTLFVTIATIFFIAFAVTLGTTLFYKLPNGFNGVREDNRNYKDEYSEFKGYVFSGNEFKADMYFRVLLPENYDENTEYPVIMFVHGNGAQGSNNTNQMKSSFIDAYLQVRSEYPAIIFMPQFPKNFHGNTNSKTKGAATNLLMACFNDGVLNRYSVDMTRIYVTGVSMGGFTSVCLAEEFPNIFAATIPLCGGTDADPVKVAKKIKDIPTWLVHSRDDSIVPFALSENLYKELVKLDADVRFKIYDDKDHGVSSFYEEYTNPVGEDSLWSWLFSKQKKY